MNAYEIVSRIKNGRNMPDAEWISIRDEIKEFLDSNPPEEERKLFVPFGYMEMVTMICDGIEYKKKWQK